MKKEHFDWFGRVAGIVGMLAFLLCVTSMVAFAEENKTAVAGSRTAEDSIYIYIRGVGDIISGTTVQIGNTLCEDIQVADVVAMGIPIKTIILLDNSISLSKGWGSQAKEFILELIDEHAEKEEYKIATFADGLTVLTDFSTDYESLKATVEEIEFLDQKSYLTDILYDFLKGNSDGNEANYTRLIIITDGADDNDIKYTQTEISELLKSSGVVIHTVGVRTTDNNVLLENLFSYARLTGGTYHMVEKDIASGDIRNRINQDYSLICLKLVPEAEIMDGGRREAKLKLNTAEGTVVLTTSLKMPFADVSSTSSGSAESIPSLQLDPVAEEQELPSIVVTPREGEETSKRGKGGVILFAGIGTVVLAAIIVSGVLFVVKGKKKQQVDVVKASRQQEEARIDGTQAEGTERLSVQQKGLAQPNGHTVRLREQVNTDIEGKTLCLRSGTGGNTEKRCFITLTDINNAQRTFCVSIDRRIAIGRGEGDIVLGHDAAVSYIHCEIIKRGNLYYINDLKSSNGTFYGGIRVHQETPVMSGGIIEVGTCKYRIMIETREPGEKVWKASEG